MVSDSSKVPHKKNKRSFEARIPTRLRLSFSQPSPRELRRPGGRTTASEWPGPSGASTGRKPRAPAKKASAQASSTRPRQKPAKKKRKRDAPRNPPRSLCFLLFGGQLDLQEERVGRAMLRAPGIPKGPFKNGTRDQVQTRGETSHCESQPFPEKIDFHAPLSRRMAPASSVGLGSKNLVSRGKPNGRQGGQGAGVSQTAKPQRHFVRQN